MPFRSARVPAQHDVLAEHHTVDARALGLHGHLHEPAQVALGKWRGIAVAFADPDEHADPKPLTIAVNLVNTDWAGKNRELVQRYFLAYQRAVYDYCQAYHGGRNRAEVMDIIIRTGLETRRDVLDRYPWPGRNPNGRIHTASLLDMQKY